MGDELIENWETLRDGELLLHLLTPTDSCRDRLAAFYHFRDRSSLDQARAVFLATKGSVDLAVIRSWSAKEGHEEDCSEFLRLVGAADA